MVMVGQYICARTSEAEGRIDRTNLAVLGYFQKRRIRKIQQQSGVVVTTEPAAVLQIPENCVLATDGVIIPAVTLTFEQGVVADVPANCGDPCSCGAGQARNEKSRRDGELHGCGGKGRAC